jgi:repressor LexA
MEKLTPIQKKALEFIGTSAEEAGRAPTVRELCAYMGYKAIGSAQDIISALRKKGFLQSPEKRTARALSLTEKAKQFFVPQKVYDDFSDIYSVPCLGSVPAGNPLEAIEERVGTIQISKSAFPHPKPQLKQLFAVKANGLSMIEAGICSGDWLVVKAQKQADHGNIIVARVDGDVTCKRLMKDKKGWFLKPENPDFHSIYAKDTPFEIVGRVLALQRTF